MSVDRLINLLVTITLMEMMVTIGLRVTFGEIVDTARNWQLVARAALANYLLVPAVAIMLLLLFQARPLVAAGFLVLAVCPGAPYAPPFTGIAHGNVPMSVGLMVILAGSSAVISPVLLDVLLPWLSDGETVHVEPLGLVATLLITQLLPLLAGLLVNHWRPRLDARLLNPCELVSKIMNLSVAGLILATQFPMLAEIRLIGLGGMLALLVATLTIGWMVGGPDRESRRTMALTTSLRNAGVGLVIVMGSFAGTPAASAALAYGIVAVFGSLIVALWWGRQASAQQHLRASLTPESQARTVARPND
jgi:bile acid:Na+ symporter, BASS family